MLNICRISTWKVQKSVFIMKSVKATRFQFGLFLLMTSFFSSSQLCREHELSQPPLSSSSATELRGVSEGSLPILSGSRGSGIFLNQSTSCICCLSQMFGHQLPYMTGWLTKDSSTNKRLKLFLYSALHFERQAQVAPGLFCFEDMFWDYVDN